MTWRLNDSMRVKPSAISTVMTESSSPKVTNNRVLDRVAESNELREINFEF
ncbi:hypothetical protein D3C83_84060 [compost metagenome]